jgi:hypothetical protein
MGNAFSWRRFIWNGDLHKPLEILCNLEQSSSADDL